MLCPIHLPPFGTLRPSIMCNQMVFFHTYLRNPPQDTIQVVFRTE